MDVSLLIKGRDQPATRGKDFSAIRCQSSLRVELRQRQLALPTWSPPPPQWCYALRLKAADVLELKRALPLPE